MIDAALANKKAFDTTVKDNIFTKWFGKEVPSQTDATVIARIKKNRLWLNNGFNLKSDPSENKWNMLCCKNDKGACSGCEDPKA